MTPLTRGRRLRVNAKPSAMGIPSRGVSTAAFFRPIGHCVNGLWMQDILRQVSLEPSTFERACMRFVVPPAGFLSVFRKHARILFVYGQLQQEYETRPSEKGGSSRSYLFRRSRMT